MEAMPTPHESVLQLPGLRILLPLFSFTFRTGSATRSSGSSPSARLYPTLHQRLSSGPLLPLPAHDVDDKRIVTLTVSENEQANIASGELEVQRAVDAEHVLWHFETASFARGITLETGVNLIPNARVQANCVNQDCLDLLR